MEFLDINRSQKILNWVAGIKSILWILAILRGVYGIIGPISNEKKSKCSRLKSYWEYGIGNK